MITFKYHVLTVKLNWGGYKNPHVRKTWIPPIEKYILPSKAQGVNS